jgi:hypothetical protein
MPALFFLYVPHGANRLGGFLPASNGGMNVPCSRREKLDKNRSLPYKLEM